MAKCGKPVTIEYVWAGERHYACIEHAMQISRIGEAIGIPISSIPVSVAMTCPNEVREEED